MNDLEWKLFEMTGMPEFYLDYKEKKKCCSQSKGRQNECKRPDYPRDGFWRI